MPRRTTRWSPRRVKAPLWMSSLSSRTVLPVCFFWVQETERSIFMDGQMPQWSICKIYGWCCAHYGRVEAYWESSKRITSSFWLSQPILIRNPTGNFSRRWSHRYLELRRSTGKLNLIMIMSLLSHLLMIIYGSGTTWFLFLITNLTRWIEEA